MRVREVWRVSVVGTARRLSGSDAGTLTTTWLSVFAGTGAPLGAEARGDTCLVCDQRELGMRFALSFVAETDKDPL